MPRNASGVYSLPSAAFTTGTTISSVAVNLDFSDIGTEITGSLPVNGSANMTGPLVLQAGVFAPLSLSVTFAGSKTTGFYLSAANVVTYVANGVPAVVFNSDTSVTFNGAINANGGLTITSGGVVSTYLFFQCQMTTFNATTILLNPYNGSLLAINGINYNIPAAGVQLSVTALASATTFYVYAFMVGTTMTLEGVTTGYTVSASGYAQKTGDASRTLVGMFYKLAATVQDTDSRRWVASYYNRKLKRSIMVGSTTRTTNGVGLGTYTALPAEFVIGYMSWGNDQPRFYAGVSNITVGAVNQAFSYAISVPVVTAVGTTASRVVDGNNATTTNTTSMSITDTQSAPVEGTAYFVGILGSTGNTLTMTCNINTYMSMDIVS